MNSSLPCTYAKFLLIMFVAAAPLARAQTLQCIETNGVKIIFPPLTDGGFDINNSRQNVVLADDFPCSTTGPITDIHLWGSWLGDNHGVITNFWIGIYSDVPAVTNFFTGQVTNSHPGVLLWQESFGLGQYAESLYGTGVEYFFNPPGSLILGTDTGAWYYCFYPTNPFVQQGTAANLTNYWLAVRANILDATNLFGWKSTQARYNDPAVWGNYQPGTGLPIGNWQSLTNPQTLQPFNLSFKLTTPTNTPPPQGCVETNGTKYVQWPNLNGGLDVWNDGPWVLADDFVCTSTGPITDIHLWGSWLNDQKGTNLAFWLAIYDDVPVSSTNNFSCPGHLLWQEQFNPGEYIESYWSLGQESFLDPGPPQIIGSDSQVWYYCFYPTNIFIQQGGAAAPRTYWLMVYATPLGANLNYYGWKTTTNIQHDVSVHAPWPGSPPTTNPGWTKTMQASTGGPLDLAFKITTATNTPPPQGCVETNGVKYVQWPNLFGGLDVWNNPFVLADDFKCTTPGPITDIHLWGSWLNDLVLTNSITFWLGIYDDVPVSPGNLFSHPGTNLLWQQWFAPGQYFEQFWSSGQETFLDPSQPAIIGTDSQVWYYCFYPTNPFVQTGDAANPKTYWLAAYAQLPVGTAFKSGWKTTTNVQSDVSVHAPWPGLPPVGNPGWTPTYLPTGAPLDLAFKLTTPTNHCVVTITCQPDKTVECGSTWTFDPPLVGPDPCCPTPPVVTINVVTNRNDPCNQSYTATWTVTDCAGIVLAVCTQNVTVLDSTPPVITCASNKTVECGTSWAFDKPTATDNCCGTNVTITVLGTVTNGAGCSLTVTRTWQATDCCTNKSNCSQTLTVVDTTPPTITCPTNIVVFTCDTNAVVFWTVTATDACSSVTITSSPPSGSSFLPNTTNTIVATAKDACGNTSTCTFTVAIRRPVLDGIYINYITTNKVVLTWTNGILQVATNVLGPYLDVPGAISPYTNTTIPWPPTNRFYRLKCNSP